MIFTPFGISVGTGSPDKPMQAEGDRAKRSTIFETPIGSDRFDAMPKSANDSDVLQTAVGVTGMQQNFSNGMHTRVNRSVQNVKRPRRGYDY